MKSKTPENPLPLNIIGKPVGSLAVDHSSIFLTKARKAIGFTVDDILFGVRAEPVFNALLHDCLRQSYLESLATAYNNALKAKDTKTAEILYKACVESTQLQYARVLLVMGISSNSIATLTSLYEYLEEVAKELCLQAISHEITPTSALPDKKRATIEDQHFMKAWFVFGESNKKP